MMKKQILLMTSFLMILILTFAAQAQTSGFSYQGRFTDSAMPQPTNETYNMQFALFDAVSGGTQVGTTISNPTVQVVNGVFTVNLDFGASSFNGAARFLEITVSGTVLSPRQPISSAPYAIRSQSAATAENSNQLGGTAANQFVQTNDTRLSDDRNPTAGSTNYIQNGTTQQTGNFNISGNGTVGGTFSASLITTSNLNVTNFNATNLSANNLNASISMNAPSYSIGSQRILSNGGVGNLFAGVQAGANNTGAQNSFFGASAGNNNTTGSENAFFGNNSGSSNGAGSFNVFFGTNAGQTNQGSFNTFIGRQAGFSNTTGAGNVFLGNDTGLNNLTGSSNTLVGSGANVGAAGLSFATAIGAGATASASNTITLGRSNGFDRIRMPGGMGDGLSLNGNTLFLRGSTDNLSSIVSTAAEVGFNSPDRFFWNANGSARMVLESNGNLFIGGVLFQNSDARYKTNIQTYAGGLDAVMRLRGVTYNWKPELQKDARLQIGFIAQEVETVLPELVNTDANGYKSVSYANAVPVLVEAVKEQQTQIQAQQAELKSVKAENGALKTQLEALRQAVCALNPQAAVCLP